MTKERTIQESIRTLAKACTEYAHSVLVLGEYTPWDLEDLALYRFDACWDGTLTEEESDFANEVVCETIEELMEGSV